eukprot:3760225-Pyramimonas_sp.AAC.1
MTAQEAAERIPRRATGPKTAPAVPKDSPGEPPGGPKRSPRGGARTDASSLPPEEGPRKPQ